MKKFIITAIAASLLGTSAMAAPGYDRGTRQVRETVIQRDNGHGRQVTRTYVQQDRRIAPVQARHWQRGQRFDYRYAPRYQVIGSPRAYRLHDAPRGYRWVQSGHDALLVGITSGIIGAVIANAIN